MVNKYLEKASTEAPSQIIHEISRPVWAKGNKENWMWFVPLDLAINWNELPIEVRYGIYLTAKQALRLRNCGV